MSMRDVQQSFQSALGERGVCTDASMVYAGKGQGYTVSCVVVNGEVMDAVSFNVPAGGDPNEVARLAAQQYIDQIGGQ